MKNPQKPKSIISQQIETFGRLGREIKISPKANISVNKAGLKTEWLTETIDVVIGIGKDHVAKLIMDTDAWKALKKGEKINITTNKEFKKSFL